MSFPFCELEHGACHLSNAADGSIAALLGSSPGASTAVHVMLEVIEKCFPERMKEWGPKVKEMIPSYGESLMKNESLLRQVQASTAEALG